MCKRPFQRIQSYITTRAQHQKRKKKFFVLLTGSLVNGTALNVMIAI